jgi:hypothetical protein
MGIPEGKKHIGNLFNGIIAQKFSLVSPERDIDLQIQENQRTTGRLNLKRPSLKHVIVKLKSLRQRDNIKNSKRKVSSYI